MRTLVKIIRRLASFAGLEIRRRRASSSEAGTDHYYDRGPTLLRFIRERNVTVLLDIGANLGQYAFALRDLGFEGRIISFEPLEEQFKLLEKEGLHDQRWECHKFAIGEEEKDITIRISANSESSSILPMLDLHLEACPSSAYIKEQPAKIKRLDMFLPQTIDESDRLMIKIDVQGYELKALKGAGKFLSRVEVIDIELSLVPLYDGQPLFLEIMSFFEENGFVPVSIQNAFTDPRNDHALQVDAIFLRRERE
jgi:FkbM family methyltransferase